MSRGLVCDWCREVLVVNDRGDDEFGESAAWLKLVAGGSTFDLCTRSCLVALVESQEFVEATDEQAEAIADIARTIREAREEREEGEADDE